MAKGNKGVKNMHPAAKNVGKDSNVKKPSALRQNNQSMADCDPYKKGSRAPKGY